jgi:hypothetical protein
MTIDEKKAMLRGNGFDRRENQRLGLPCPVCQYIKLALRWQGLRKLR